MPEITIPPAYYRINNCADLWLPNLSLRGGNANVERGLMFEPADIESDHSPRRGALLVDQGQNKMPITPRRGALLVDTGQKKMTVSPRRGAL